MRKEYTANGYKEKQENVNIYDALRSSAEKYPHKTAVIQEDESITYRRLLENIDRLAIWLKDHFHIEKGERVGLLFVNSIYFYTAFYAVAKLGAIAVLVNTKMQSEEIEYVLRDTETHCLIMNERWLEKTRVFLKKLKIDRILTEKKEKTPAESLTLYSMDEIFRKKGTETELSSVREKNLTAVILHTSGTTGKPKGIMVTHENMMGTAYGYEDALRVTEKDVAVLSVPVFHILGLSCVSNLFFYIGGTIVVFEKFEANKVLTAIEKYHGTHFHSVPAVYIKMMNEAERHYNLDSLRIAVCGGALIGEEDKRRFYQMAPKASFRIAYGLTETAGSGVLSFRHGDPGREVYNCTVQIQDENGKISQYGEGEAVCSGSIVTTKVWGREDTGQGMLHTGDIVRKEKDGSIYVLDRIKDVINRGGEKLFPSFIENALLQYPGIVQASVFPVSDELYGEVPAAVIVTESGTEIAEDELKKNLMTKLGKFELPQYIEVWKEEDIPVTGNGKVRKKVLREIFEKKLADKGEENEET